MKRKNKIINESVLFRTYLRLYPGKAYEISEAMDRGRKAAEEDGLTGKAILKRMEAEILDAL